RAGGRPPQVVVLLNGARELGRFQAGADWQDYSFAIDGGLLKPNDVVIEIRSETARHSADDPRQVGVLLDRATYRVGPAPIVPYPAQLLYGALAAGMLYVLLRRATFERSNVRTFQRFNVARRWPFVAGVLLLGSWFFVLYRAQPPYPYPLLRLLPAIDGALAALLALRYGPALARRAPALLDALALGGIGAWTAATLLAAQRHVTLSLPGVEKDFRVFALRSARLAGSYPAGTTNPDLDGVFRADGFYNLGYPLLLWLARPLTSDNPFLAARLIAALSGMLLLLATWWLARQMLGRGPALLALVALALSPLIVEHALYLGTDMPFAAACTLALALILCSTKRLPTTSVQTDKETRRQGDRVESRLPVSRSPSLLVRSFVVRRSSFVVLAGLAAGAAFLIRHPGLLLLPLGWLTIWQPQVASRRSQDTLALRPATWSLRPVIIFTVAFALAVLPQIVVNLRDTGGPLYSQQAKNVWQAVFGGGDWGRWGETANDIGIGQVVAQDPARFLANWWANLRGFLGTGGEDTREFGQAAQLRLLAFPANWLGVVGLLGWLASMFCHHQDTKTPRNEDQTGSKPGSPARPLTRSPAH
ncbi:MAG TPA: glycosyltransferase family 39 protein, partial [Roseiflexaceae bacterium]